MKKRLLWTVAVAALFPFAANANTVVIDFEESTGNFQPIGDTYAGLGVSFDGCNFYDSNSNYPGVSGTSSALCTPGTGTLLGTINFDGPVSDVGAFFNVYANPLTLTAFGTAGLIGSLTIDPTSQPTPGGPQFYQLGFSGITSVELSSNDAFFHNFDDLTFTTAMVPEPGILALLGAGLFGMGFARRRNSA